MGRALAPPAAAAIAATTCHNSAADSWDSDDEVPPRGGANGASQGWGAAPAPPPPPPAPAPTTGHATAGHESGWDSDDDDVKPVASRPPPPPPAPQFDVCGGRRPPPQAFVAASAVKPTRGGNDLDDLVGDLLAAGSGTAGGSKGSFLVPDFQCTACDFQILCIEDVVWANDVEYMFFRNNYPTVDKLRGKLHPQLGCRAYCCQCSWKSADAMAELSDVAEGLRWRQIGGAR